jgi:hypothetical protein
VIETIEPVNKRGCNPVVARPYRSGILSRALSFLPLAVLVAMTFFAPRFSEPMFGKPPDVLGIPLGVVFQGLAMLWMLWGVLVVWRARSRLVESLGLMLFTIPATVAVVYGPAIILILQNLNG